MSNKPTYRRYESFFQPNDDVLHQSLISCKKHRQSLIQSLISVSARGDHVGAKSNPKTHACFWKIFCSGTVGSSGCSVQQTYLVATYRRYESFFQPNDDVLRKVGRASGGAMLSKKTLDE